MRISEGNLILPALWVISENPGIATSTLIKELESILRTKIAGISSIRDTQTFIALSTYKESAKIKLPDDAS